MHSSRMRTAHSLTIFGGGDMRGRRCPWQGCAWQGGVHGRGACVAGGMPPDRMTDACLRAAIKTFAHFEFIL